MLKARPWECFDQLILIDVPEFSSGWVKFGSGCVCAGCSGGGGDARVRVQCARGIDGQRQGCVQFRHSAKTPRTGHTYHCARENDGLYY